MYRYDRRRVMYSRTRSIGLALLAIGTLVFAGCATMRVNSFLERGANLGQYRTYGWSPADRLETGDPRLDNNPFFHERIRGAVEKHLAARGYEKTSSGTPDLVLHYHASISEQIDVSTLDRDGSNCFNAADCRPYVYDAGSLVIDVVDARTDKLVWRGWAEDTMEGAIDNQRLMEQKVDQAVARILQRLPRRL
jgi:hypothetical protein